MAKEKEWMIEVRLVRRSTVFVKAKTADEAMEKVEHGQWDAEVEGELIDWEPRGEPQENV